MGYGKPEFVNPYNFIPLTEKKKLAEPGERNLTGVIEYSLLTKTPLFIPNTSNDHALRPEDYENKKHKSYEFYSYTNLSDEQEDGGEGVSQKPDRTEYKKEPVIPGSEMRGMCRSHYEILTESCMSVVDADSALSKRTLERFRAGLIRKKKDGTYELLEAYSYRWPERRLKDCEKRIVEGEQVWFRKRKEGNLYKAFDVTKKEKNGRREGYVVIGEKAPCISGKTKNWHIFEKKPSAKVVDITLDPLEIILKKYEKDSDRHQSYRYYRNEFEKFKKKEAGTLFPVYYSCYDSSDNKNKYIMLSPACITKEIYQNRLRELLKSFNSCSDKRDLCPACALFGMVNRGTAVASRIRFTDLTVEKQGEYEDDFYHDAITLPPLSTPKLSNTEFYLKRPEGAQFWTYDYYVNNQGEVVVAAPEISGRKFYWHQMKEKIPHMDNREEINITIRPVKRGVVFHGKVYFQNISEKELDQLIWLLNAGADKKLEKKRHGYKLGSGKPLGLGSIAVAVDRVRLRRISIKGDQIEREEINYPFRCKDNLFDKKVITDFCKITDFKAVTENIVSYPFTKDQVGKDGYVKDGYVEVGYKWFVQNHGSSRPDGKAPLSRKEMCIKEHMVPLEPKLKPVSKPK